MSSGAAGNRLLNRRVVRVLAQRELHLQMDLGCDAFAVLQRGPVGALTNRVDGGPVQRRPAVGVTDDLDAEPGAVVRLSADDHHAGGRRLVSGVVDHDDGDVVARLTAGATRKYN